MELQLVNFEQAKVLSELGFPQNSRLIETYYYDDGTLFNGCSGDYEDTHNVKETFVAPFLELVAKWLRDEKNIQLTVRFRGKKWYYDIMSGYEIFSVGKDEETYEQALSAGIDKAIEILKSK